MAMKQTITLVDDLDGGEADRTVRFALDGIEYEIDLAESNIEELTSALAPFIDAARRASSRPRRAATSGPSPSRPRAPRPALADKPRRARSGDTAAIREWASVNGFTVGERGRIPDAVKQAWAEANPGA